MNRYINIIKGNYLQYVRSYSFLITIGISLGFAFSIIPSSTASYETLRFGKFTGEYNGEWIGLVTAVFSSIFLSFCGFFLISGSIKKDVDSRIGHIIGSTGISNATYVLTKMVSNFCILFTILMVIFMAAIGLFFLYGEGFEFHFSDFILPYIFIAIPTMIIVACLAIILELMLPRFPRIQYGIFFIIFIVVAISPAMEEANVYAGVFGIHHPINSIASQISSLYPGESVNLTIGFVPKYATEISKITIESISYPSSYFISRLMWMVLMLALIFVASIFFHRFDLKQKVKVKKASTFSNSTQSNRAGFQFKDAIGNTEFAPSLLPLIKAELKLFVRRQSRWLWLVTVGGMVAMLLLPIQQVHQLILPILWFLQIGMWSDIASKDYTLRTHYFTASAFMPVRRLFLSRTLAAGLIALVIATPLLVRLVLDFNIIGVMNIIFGAFFIVLLANLLGTLTKSKKLFEVLFFFIVYCNLNMVPVSDYFGGLHNSWGYTAILLLINAMMFLVTNYWKMKYSR